MDRVRAMYFIMTRLPKGSDVAPAEDGDFRFYGGPAEMRDFLEYAGNLK